MLKVLLYHTKSIADILSISKYKYNRNTENHKDVIDFWRVDFSLFVGRRVHHLDARKVIQYNRLLDDRKGGWYKWLACHNCGQCGYDKDRPVNCFGYKLVKSINMVIGILDQICCLSRIRQNLRWIYCKKESYLWERNEKAILDTEKEA